MVVWIIGLSGAGKTTLANKIVSNLRKSETSVVLIDGDSIREAFDNDLGHGLEDRRKNADRISKFCKLLDEQSIHVVCAILSLFPESRSWNRKNIKNYYEVYIKTRIEQLKKRDSKGLYKKYDDGELKHVAGMDIKFIPPNKPDLIIDNTKTLNELLEYTSVISQKIKNQ